MSLSGGRHMLLGALKFRREGWNGRLHCAAQKLKSKEALRVLHHCVCVVQCLREIHLRADRALAHCLWASGTSDETIGGSPFDTGAGQLLKTSSCYHSTKTCSLPENIFCDA